MRALVLGGTGNVGRQLLSQLLALSSPPTIRASARSPVTAHFPAAVEAVAADVTDPSTFPALFANVDRAFLYAREGGKYDELSEAAKAAGVQRLVLLSSVSVEEHPESKIGAYHKRAEDAIKASGVHYTFIRAGFFSSNFHMFVDPQLARGDGVVELPYPNALIAPVAEEDMAAVALTALTTDKLQNEAPRVGGPEKIDMGTAVTVIGKVRAAAGKPALTVKQLSEEEWVSKYTDILPIPPFVVKMMAGMWSEMVTKQPWIASSEKLTGKQSTMFEQWVENGKDEWASAGDKLKAVTI